MTGTRRRTDMARSSIDCAACARCGRLARAKAEIVRAALRGAVPMHVADAVIAVMGLRHD